MEADVSEFEKLREELNAVGRRWAEALASANAATARATAAESVLVEAKRDAAQARASNLENSLALAEARGALREAGAKAASLEADVLSWFETAKNVTAQFEQAERESQEHRKHLVDAELQLLDAWNRANAADTALRKAKEENTLQHDVLARAVCVARILDRRMTELRAAIEAGEWYCPECNHLHRPRWGGVCLRHAEPGDCDCKRRVAALARAGEQETPAARVDLDALEAGLLGMLKCETCLPDQPGKMLVDIGYRPPPYDEDITALEDCAECDAMPERPALRDGVRELLRIARAAVHTPPPGEQGKGGGEGPAEWRKRVEPAVRRLLESIKSFHGGSDGPATTIIYSDAVENLRRACPEADPYLAPAQPAEHPASGGEE